uniref:Protein Wnt n=1 Tax=Anopheles culicifacies TaxID=139723 RepID=A0A182M798_9DIPT
MRSLGIKSPFIVFQTEQEVLSNNSVLLNLTDIRNKLKSVHNLDHFIRPIDSNADNKYARKDPFAPKGVVGRLGTAGSSTNSPPAAPPVFSAESAFSSGNVSITFLTTIAPSFVNHFEKNNGNEGEHGARPISSIRSKPQTPSVLGAGDHMISDDDGGLGNGKKERKYIIPLALKTSTNEKEKTSSVFHGSSTNIDDLKRHILMLQNLTQSDKNFQSKFVVFPSLQKNGTERTGQSAVTTAPAAVSPLHLPLAGSTPKDAKEEHRNFGPSSWGQSMKGDTNATNNRTVVRSQISTSINMPKKAFPDSHGIMSDRKEEGLQAFKTEKITIVPQVFLQNDQTSETVSDKENNLNESAKNRAVTDSTKMTAQSHIENSSPFGRMRETREKNVIRKFGHKSKASASSKSEDPSGLGPEHGGAYGNARNNQTVLTTLHTKTSGTMNKGFPIRVGSVGIEEQRWNMNGPQLNGTSLASGEVRVTKGEGKKKQRKNVKRRGGKHAIKANGPKEQPKTVILNDDAIVLQMDDIERTSSSDVQRQETVSVRPTKSGRSAGSRKKSSSSSRVRRNENGGTQQAVIKQQQQQLYASTGRLHGQIGRDGRYESRMAAVSSLESLATTTDQLAGERFAENNNRSHNYRNRTLSADGSEKDIVDLNPELCYTLSALSGGQQKLCAQHTSIMPAISRGARAAIQECKHQFRNRRWNCSIMNDDTVFGPISNIGE